MEASGVRMNGGARKRTDKGRRSWSQREEEVLIVGLKEIVANGWKSENGFKVGYLQTLEQHMVKAFPGTDIRTIPHINSKVHVWKKYYSSLLSMLSRSGIGFNHSTKMIEANDDAWSAYTKVDTGARLMRFKSWPFYEDWLEIFGKDRATGVQAEDFVTAVNNVMNGVQSQEQDHDIYDGFERLFDGYNDDMETMSVCQLSSQPSSQPLSQPDVSSASGKKRSSRKRKSTDQHDAVFELLGTFCENTNARLGEIARRIGYEQDISYARKEVFSAVGKIHGLNLHEKLLVSKLLVKDNEDLELFFSLPDEAQSEFAKMKLAGNL